MLRRLSTLVSAVSLLLCAVTCVLWVRSYGHRYTVQRGGDRSWIEAEGADGRLRLLRVTGCTVTDNGPTAANRLTVVCGGYSDWVEGPSPSLVPVLASSGTATAATAFTGGRWESGRVVPRGYLQFLQFNRFSGVPAPAVRAAAYQLLDVHWCWAAAVPAVLPSGWAAVWGTHKLWVRRRFATGRCPACGYDLRATPGRCPECGRVPGKPVG